MKFRARIASRRSLELFIQVSGTLAKLATVCVLRVCPSKLYFCPGGPGGLCEPRLWCEVRRGAFHRFCMEGASQERDEIYLELVSEHLAGALRNVAGAPSVKLQLTNKERPCLTVTVELQARPGHARVLVHDLPTRVMPQRWWAAYAEPHVPTPDASIYLPSLKTLRSMVERMARMGSHVQLEADLTGRMNLSVETELVSVKSYFRDLGNPPASALARPRDRDPESMARVRVENRCLLQVLEGQQVNPTTALCNVLSDTMLHFVLIHEEVSLQYFIPAS
ncbi:checkpoint protein HUS1B [Nannospalax galili]|uniref:checkpoint protein HUS1B n=1 Tax=Nannospalax galili TaxID=1026970 RepID=UPI0004ED70FB|nr:checkpoint protein HUS1B [Nannospalax galili]